MNASRELTPNASYELIVDDPSTFTRAFTAGFHEPTDQLIYGRVPRR
jgi:hypothetical protein